MFEMFGRLIRSKLFYNGAPFPYSACMDRFSLPSSFVVTHVLDNINILDCWPCLDVCYGVPSSVHMNRVTVVMVDVCYVVYFAHDSWPPCLGACYEVTISVLMTFSSMLRYGVFCASDPVLRYFGA